MDDLITRLRAKLDEAEAWAVAASQTSEPGTPTGEHWRWECGTCDTPITINPVTDAYVECPDGCSSEVFLRSAEEYPSSVGPLSAAIVPYAQEVPAVAGAFIALHDPAATLRMVAAHRKILNEVFRYEAKIDGEWGCCHNAEAIAAGACPDSDPNEIPVVVALAEGYGIVAA